MEKTPFTIGMGENLRRMRNARGWTVEYVAEKMEMSVDAVRKYESGQRRLHGELIQRAAQMLDCSILDIFAGLDPRKPNVIIELNKLSPAASRIMYRLATEWDGDIEALVRYIGMLAAFPVEERREEYMRGTIRRDELIWEGRIKPEDLPEDMETMERSLGGYYEL